MTDDRAERLSRSRRSKADDETSEPSKQSETSESEEQEASGTTASVKDEYVGVYLYVPDEQSDAINDLYDELVYRYDGDLEKTRHFYPLLVRYGFESLQGLESSEIQERLEDTLDDV